MPNAIVLALTKGIPVDFSTRNPVTSRKGILFIVTGFGGEETHQGKTKESQTS